MSLKQPYKVSTAAPGVNESVGVGTVRDTTVGVHRSRVSGVRSLLRRQLTEQFRLLGERGFAGQAVARLLTQGFRIWSNGIERKNLSVERKDPMTADAPRQEQAVGRVYKRPVLVRLGNLTDLTHAIGRRSMADGGMMAGMRRSQ